MKKVGAHASNYSSPLTGRTVSDAGHALLKKLATIWTQFYTSILPTLQAMFTPVQVPISLVSYDRAVK